MNDTRPIHLDTSFLIRALVPGTSESRRLEEWLSGRRPMAISAIAWAEFLAGPLDDDVFQLAARLVGVPAAVTGNHAEQAARLFNTTGRHRGAMSDCLIAAVAIEDSAQLATADVSFVRFADAGLALA